MGQQRVLHRKPFFYEKLALLRGQSNPLELGQFISI